MNRIFSFKFLYLLIALILIGGVIVLDAVIIKQHAMMRTLVIGSQKYDLAVADTPVQLEQGLGGRTSLASNKGMLFVMGPHDDGCFWMKGMNFPLDMIWLNSSGQVIHMAANVSPNSYPNEYCSETRPAYVIELNAGAIACGNIQDGQTLYF